MGNCLDFTGLMLTEHAVSNSSEDTPWFSFDTLLKDQRPLVKIIRVLRADEINANFCRNDWVPIVFVVGVAIAKSHRALKAYLIMDQFAYKQGYEEQAYTVLLQNCINQLHEADLRDWGIVSPENALVLFAKSLQGPQQNIGGLMATHHDLFSSRVDEDGPEPSIVDQLRPDFFHTESSSQLPRIVKSPPTEEDLEIIDKRDLP